MNFNILRGLFGESGAPKVDASAPKQYRSDIPALPPGIVAGRDGFKENMPAQEKPFSLNGPTVGQPR